MRSEKLDIKTVIGITGAYVAYMMGSGFSTGQEILQYFAQKRDKKNNDKNLLYEEPIFLKLLTNNLFFITTTLFHQHFLVFYLK